MKWKGLENFFSLVKNQKILALSAMADNRSFLLEWLKSRQEKSGMIMKKARGKNRRTPEQKIEKRLEQAGACFETNPQESLQIFKEAEKIARDLADTRADERNLDLLARTLGAMLIVYVKLGQENEALETADEIFRIGQRLVLKNPVPRTYYREAGRIFLLERVLSDVLRMNSQNTSMVDRGIFYMNQAVRKEFTLEYFKLLSDLYWSKLFLLDQKPDKKDDVIAVLNELVGMMDLSAISMAAKQLDEEEVDELAESLRNDIDEAAKMASNLQDYDLVKSILQKGSSLQLTLSQYSDDPLGYFYNAIRHIGHWAGAARISGDDQEAELLMERFFELSKVMADSYEVADESDGQRFAAAMESLASGILDIVYEQEDEQRGRWEKEKQDLIARIRQ